MASVLSLFRDSLTSLVSRMGTERDKAATVFYTNPILTDDQIAAAYRGSWLPRKIVDIPALDACRKWRNWQAEDDQIEAIEAEEKRLNLKAKLLETIKKGRLWGGAALFIGTGEQDVSRPLDPERLGAGGLKYLTVLTRRQLSGTDIEDNPASEWYGSPRSYKLANQNGGELTIHPSRLVMFKGAMPPDDDIGASILNGWGESVLTATLDAIKNADSTAGNIASLIFEAKIDIIRIPDFMANVGDALYRQQIMERYALANTGKGINGTLMLDKEEEYESKSAQLSGLTDILMAFMQIVSGAADIPVTRLLGQSPAGMNATGASDMKNYHDRIQSIQELEMTPAMARLDECLIRSSLGSRDKDIYYNWSPLEQMSEKERAEIFKMKADAARQLVGSGTGQEIIPRDAVSDALVNSLIEDGSLPGLEAAIDEYGRLSEQEPSEEELAGAVASDPSSDLSGSLNDGLARRICDYGLWIDKQKRRGVGGGNPHFNPSQPRGGNGRWVETGAEEKRSPISFRAKSQDEIADEIFEIALREHAAGAKVLALRVDDLEERAIKEIGERLPPSRVWRNGSPTEKTLDGTSAIVIAKNKAPTKADVDAAIDLLYGKRSWTSQKVNYYGKTVYLVKGSSSKKGKDLGEGVIKDPVVIGVFSKSENIGPLTGSSLANKREE